MIYPFFKNICDFCCGLILTLLTLPILIVIMILIRIESKGPPIFKQTRIGKGGNPFTIYKLRSMTYRPQQSGHYATSMQDNRITKVGRFLRKTSLDEFPQFWNLVLGDMSLIGPRPDVPQQKNDYTDLEWQLRHRLKPGITGLAQSTFRSSSSMQNRKRLDIFYTAKSSLGLDLIIVFRTLKILVKAGVQN